MLSYTQLYINSLENVARMTNAYFLTTLHVCLLELLQCMHKMDQTIVDLAKKLDLTIAGWIGSFDASTTKGLNAFAHGLYGHEKSKFSKDDLMYTISVLDRQGLKDSLPPSTLDIPGCKKMLIFLDGDLEWYRQGM